MSDEMQKALLRKDGLQAGHVDSGELEKLHQKLERSRKAIRRLRWVLAISWAWAALYVVVFRVALFVPKPGALDPMPALGVWELVILWLAMPGLVMLFVAVVCTVSYLIRSRELSMTEIQFRLARLEEILRGVALPPDRR